MEVRLSTPGLLFPAIALILSSYTSRFLGLAEVIRELHARYRDERTAHIRDQIEHLQRRLRLIRRMLLLAIQSSLGCVACILLVYAGLRPAAVAVFAGSTLLISISMVISWIDTLMSVKALDLELHHMRGTGPDDPRDATRD